MRGGCWVWNRSEAGGILGDLRGGLKSSWELLLGERCFFLTLRNNQFPLNWEEILGTSKCTKLEALTWLQLMEKFEPEKGLFRLK